MPPWMQRLREPGAYRLKAKLLRQADRREYVRSLQKQHFGKLEGRLCLCRTLCLCVRLTAAQPLCPVKDIGPTNSSPSIGLTWVPGVIWRAMGWARELLPTMPSTAWPREGVNPCSSPWLKYRRPSMPCPHPHTWVRGQITGQEGCKGSQVQSGCRCSCGVCSRSAACVHQLTENNQASAGRVMPMSHG